MGRVLESTHTHKDTDTDLSQLTTSIDGQFLGRLAWLWAIGFQALDDIHPFDNASKDHVFPIQPGCLDGRQEELWPIGVGSSIRHGKDSRSSVFQVEVLIGKLFPVNGFASSSVSASEIPTLDHEVGNDPMEHWSLEPESWNINNNDNNNNEQ